MRSAQARIRLVGLIAVLALAGCSTASLRAVPDPRVSRTLHVVAAESVWGSLARQLGGAHVRVRSIIDNPNVDPHAFEPTAADARDLASADLAVVNGVGYDTWATKLLAANPVRGRITTNIGHLVGTPANGNPHRWYSPSDVRTVVDALTADFKALDPADSASFDALRTQLLTTGLSRYFAAINTIKTTYAGTRVGASESVFAPLATGLGLDLVTPESFLDAVSEGSDPSARDKALVDRQLKDHQVSVYVYNSQNATPDVQAQVRTARAAGIPVVAVTETPSPAGATFQDWQVAQLDALRQALAQATGR